MWVIMQLVELARLDIRLAVKFVSLCLSLNKGYANSSN